MESERIGGYVSEQQNVTDFAVDEEYKLNILKRNRGKKHGAVKGK